MANHMTQRKTTKQRTQHYAKASRQARHGRRWDARVKEMNAEFFRRDAEARIALERDFAEALAMNAALAEKAA